MPASATRFAPSGFAATLLPISKNVAFALLSFRICSSRSVYGPGPSSNVNATHLALAQSTPSGASVAACPVNNANTTTATAATTPSPIRPYCQVRLSLRFGTAAAYRSNLE